VRPVAASAAGRFVHLRGTAPLPSSLLVAPAVHTLPLLDARRPGLVT
jgi:hypothetical protein